MLLVGGQLPLWPRGWYTRERAGIFLLMFPCYQTSAVYICSRNPATRYLLIMAGLVEVYPPNSFFPSNEVLLAAVNSSNILNK